MAAEAQLCPPDALRGRAESAAAEAQPWHSDAHPDAHPHAHPDANLAVNLAAERAATAVLVPAALHVATSVDPGAARLLLAAGSAGRFSWTA